MPFRIPQIVLANQLELSALMTTHEYYEYIGSYLKATCSGLRLSLSCLVPLLTSLRVAKKGEVVYTGGRVRVREVLPGGHQL